MLSWHCVLESSLTVGFSLSFFFFSFFLSFLFFFPLLLLCCSNLTAYFWKQPVMCLVTVLRISHASHCSKRQCVVWWRGFAFLVSESLHRRAGLICDDPNSPREPTDINRSHMKRHILGTRYLIWFLIFTWRFPFRKYVLTHVDRSLQWDSNDLSLSVRYRSAEYKFDHLFIEWASFFEEALARMFSLKNRTFDVGTQVLAPDEGLDQHDVFDLSSPKYGVKLSEAQIGCSSTCQPCLFW